MLPLFSSSTKEPQHCWGSLISAPDVVRNTETVVLANYPSPVQNLAWIAPLAVLLSACAGSPVLPPPEGSGSLEDEPATSASLQAPTEPGLTPASGAIDPDLVNRRVLEFEAYVPPQLIPPDGIRPIYAPAFSPATESPLEDDELVIGIALNGQAKAYPITVLRVREMVNDELAGLPILVTW